jgi:hypothetical protein
MAMLKWEGSVTRFELKKPDSISSLTDGSVTNDFSVASLKQEQSQLHFASFTFIGLLQKSLPRR